MFMLWGVNYNSTGRGQMSYYTEKNSSFQTITSYVKSNTVILSPLSHAGLN